MKNSETDVLEDLEDQDGQTKRDKRLLFITFYIEGERYGLPADVMDEIVEDVKKFNIPGAPDEVIGATEMRGKVIPILDLKKCLGLARSTDGWKEILLVEIAENIFALPVDKLKDIISPNEDQLVEPSMITNLQDNKLKKIISLGENESVRVIDVEQLISESLKSFEIGKGDETR